MPYGEVERRNGRGRRHSDSGGNGRLALLMAVFTLASALVSGLSTYYKAQSDLIARIAEVRETYVTKGEYRSQWIGYQMLAERIARLEAENAVQAEQLRALRERSPR